MKKIVELLFIVSEIVRIKSDSAVSCKKIVNTKFEFKNIPYTR